MNVTNSIYTYEEAKLLRPSQAIRQRMLHPITQILIFCKITSNELSYLSVFFGLAFCLLAKANFTLAFWLLVVSIVLDGLDGVLARELRTDTTAGAFTDAICDQTVLTLSVAGLIWQGTINPLLGITFIYIYSTFTMLIIFHKLLNISSHYLFRPSRNLFFLTIAIYYFSGVNILNYFLLFTLLTIPLLVTSFLRIKTRI